MRTPIRAFAVLLFLTLIVPAKAEDTDEDSCMRLLVDLTHRGYMMVGDIYGQWVEVLVDEWFWDQPEVIPAEWLDVVQCALRPEGGTVLMEVRSIRTGELLGKRTYAHGYLPVD